MVMTAVYIHIINKIGVIVIVMTSTHTRNDNVCVSLAPSGTKMAVVVKQSSKSSSNKVDCTTTTVIFVPEGAKVRTSYRFVLCTSHNCYGVYTLCTMRHD